MPADPPKREDVTVAPEGVSATGAVGRVSALADRQPKKDPLPDVLDLLLRLTTDQARLMSGLATVTQHFVRERCDAEPIDPVKLEKDWNEFAKLLKSHADAMAEEVKRG